MRNAILFILAVLLVDWSHCQAAEVVLSQPLDYQVIQRDSGREGQLLIRGSLQDAAPERVSLEVRIAQGDVATTWKALAATWKEDRFECAWKIPAGGWYRFQLRVVAAGNVLCESVIEHVGVGEVLVVAGQSNSANHGEVKQSTETQRVATFDGTRWKLANDPQPGASGEGGSFMPPLGDALVQQLDVPIGFIACGIGATSVREWLPKGNRFPNPPTIESRVKKLEDGTWASNGEAFTRLVNLQKQVGPRGFRAVLWHQGESDANQKDATRTLAGSLYREYLETIIRETRQEIGWSAPWFVAQVSYHVPGDEASPDIREAQASLWRERIAMEGPDSDALKGDLRERQGKGVHFSNAGLKAHAAKWAEKLLPWIESELEPSWQSAKKPNILFLLSDDHSYPFLSTYGDTNVKTPVLDQLATDGIKFHRFFTAALQCVPSRAALMTGRSPVAARMTRFSAPLPRDEIKLPELLREQGGYFTGVCGRSFHLDGAAKGGAAIAEVFQRHNLKTFGDRVDSLNTCSDKEVAGQVAAFLDRKPADKPFFMWANFSDPHHVWNAPAEFRPDPASLKLPKHGPDLPGVREQVAD